MNPLLLLQTIGAGSEAIGAFFGARSQRDQMRFQARMDAINAGLADLQARDAMLQGQKQQQAIRQRGGQVKSSQRVAMAANGIDLGSDLATNLLTSTDFITETDANTAAANAIKSAWGYKTEATNMRSRSAIGNAMASGINPGLSAATSLLGNAGKVAGSWYQARGAA